MNLIDQLLKQAETGVEQSEILRKNVSVYSDIMKILPRVFPMPDDMHIRSPDIEYDVALIYILRADETDESLRMILSVIFGAMEWEGGMDKGENTLTLRSVIKHGEYSIFIKILGADFKHYSLNDVKDVGLKLIGKITCIKFTPWENSRPDITPDILLQQCIESNIMSFSSNRQAKILSELACVLPVNLPKANEVSATLGLNYDVGISYLHDPQGKKRQYFDKHLGYNGWSATLNKKTIEFSLHTIIDIKCRLGKLKLRVSIINACRNKETLFLVADLPELLIYRAVRSTDSDYNNVLKMFEVGSECN